MSSYVLVHMCEEHCLDAASTLQTINTDQIDPELREIVLGEQIFFKNNTVDGYSSGWVVLIYDELQNKQISESILKHPYQAQV